MKTGFFTKIDHVSCVTIASFYFSLSTTFQSVLDYGDIIYMHAAPTTLKYLDTVYHQVINSHGDGPYAIRTALGWDINGPLQENGSNVEAEFPSAVVNRISVCRLDEMLSKQYNHDFNERAMEEKGLSREDIKFIEIVENSATLEDGHYSLKLPFIKGNFRPIYLCPTTSLW